jgi:hypothetical protein
MRAGAYPELGRRINLLQQRPGKKSRSRRFLGQLKVRRSVLTLAPKA